LVEKFAGVLTIDYVDPPGFKFSAPDDRTLLRAATING